MFGVTITSSPMMKPSGRAPALIDNDSGNNKQIAAAGFIACPHRIRWRE